MVRLHVKKGDESQFLYDTHVDANVEDVIHDIAIIYNGRLKISRLCYGKYLNRSNVSKLFQILKELNTFGKFCINIYNIFKCIIFQLYS